MNPAKTDNEKALQFQEKAIEHFNQVKHLRGIASCQVDIYAVSHGLNQDRAASNSQRFASAIKLEEYRDAT